MPVAPPSGMGIFQEHSVHWRFAQGRFARPAGRSGFSTCSVHRHHVARLRSGGRRRRASRRQPKSNGGYGKENQTLGGLDDRTIAGSPDDAMKFAAREIPARQYL
ncbi:MAG: hypothetical protein R3C04_00455 [Hyphomonas sp.]